MTPIEARTIVASALRQGLLRAPEPPKPSVEPPDPRKAAREATRARWAHLRGVRGVKAWAERSREERLEFKRMCMDRLRTRQRGEAWNGPEWVRRTKTSTKALVEASQ